MRGSSEAAKVIAKKPGPPSLPALPSAAAVSESKDNSTGETESSIEMETKADHSSEANAEDNSENKDEDNSESKDNAAADADTSAAAEPASSMDVAIPVAKEVSPGSHCAGSDQLQSLWQESRMQLDMCANNIHG